MKASDSNGLTVERKTFTERQTVAGVEKTYVYTAWAISGWLNGRRVRKQAPTQGEALTIKERLGIEAADNSGQVRVRFGLGNDELRHTFISAHVTAFRSMGDAASGWRCHGRP